VPTFPATPLPEPRTEVAGALWFTLDATVIALAGGFTADGSPSSRLDLLGVDGVWTRGPDLPAAYDHASLVSTDLRLWLVGGYADGVPTRKVFSLGFGEDKWREESPLDEPRGALATVPVDGGLIAIGGANDSGVLATTEIYDLEPGEWRAGPELGTPREHTSAVAVLDTVYAIGGRQLSLDTNLRSVESLRIPDGEWKSEPDLSFSRGGIAAAGVNYPCVAGGEEPSGTIGSVECLRDGAWEVVATLAVPRHGLAMVAVGNVLHVLGGGPQPGLFVSDAHEVFEI
jgi:hypothetical protein